MPRSHLKLTRKSMSSNLGCYRLRFQLLIFKINLGGLKDDFGISLLRLEKLIPLKTMFRGQRRQWLIKRWIAYKLLKSHFIIEKHLTLCILTKKLTPCNWTLRVPSLVTIFQTIDTWVPGHLLILRNAPNQSSTRIWIVLIHEGNHACVFDPSITQKAHICLNHGVSLRRMFTFIKHIKVFPNLLGFLLVFLNVDLILSWHNWKELANSLILFKLMNNLFISHKVNTQMLLLNKFRWLWAARFVILVPAFLFLGRGLLLFEFQDIVLWRLDLQIRMWTGSQKFIDVGEVCLLIQVDGRRMCLIQH